MRALTEALNWTPDSIERVLRGDEPHLAKPEGPPLAESDILAEVARLRARIEEIEARLASERPADDGPGTSRSA